MLEDPKLIKFCKIVSEIFGPFAGVSVSQKFYENKYMTAVSNPILIFVTYILYQCINNVRKTFFVIHVFCVPTGLPSTMLR